MSSGDWAGAAAVHFEEARKLYRLEHTVVRFSLTVQSWMPEYQDERLWENGRRRRLISYGKNQRAARKKAARWMGVFAAVARKYHGR